jgi:hypothetical protein
MFCKDCETMPIYLVVSQKELSIFSEKILNGSSGLQIRIVSFAEVYPPLSDRTNLYSEETFLKEKDRFTFQSMKKMHGCLYTNAKYCWLLDSEVT